MADISNLQSQTQISDTKGEGKNPETQQVTPKPNTNNSTSGGEVNRTDPKVCHDPSLDVEGIVRNFSNQNKVEMENGELSTNNLYDMTKTDAIEYPLVTINDRNIENHDIIELKILYNEFLPKVVLRVHDEHQSEQKINTTQMSSIIRVCITAKVDKVYRKLLLNFRTYDVNLDTNNPSLVNYYGEMYIPGFRQINTKHIWMETICPCQPNCGQGGHINANTWEMLHKIAQLSGLGFAATKKCKEIPDHVIRNIYSQRFNQYIEQQLLHCGTDENNLFDAWVDFYGYIVMVNVPWVMDERITSDELTITATIGISSTSNDTPEQEPKTILRTLTNHNLTSMPSNMEIADYSMKVDNESISHGTLEKVYTVSFKTNICQLDNTDIQSKQDSVDGDFIEDYNTGKNRPIPKYYFNDDAWTGLSGGYDLHKQKVIRNAYFRKKRQSILNVQLKNVNLGLQRGTLVDVMIFDNDVANKKHTFVGTNNVTGEQNEAENSPVNLSKENNQEDIIMDGGAYMPNIKLSGLYYIDGMSFDYSNEAGRIIQTLFLIKKGKTSGYENRHTSPRVPKNEIVPKSTLPQDPPYLLETSL